MIKYFGRWVVALMLAMIAAGWFIERSVSAATITRALWIIYVAAPIAIGAALVTAANGAGSASATSEPTAKVTR